MITDEEQLKDITDALDAASAKVHDITAIAAEYYSEVSSALDKVRDEVESCERAAERDESLVCPHCCKTFKYSDM